MCPTSNLFTMDLKDYVDHHFDTFYKDGHKICICTDDQGVFEAN